MSSTVIEVRRTSEGDPLAFKITTPTDLLLAEALLARAE